MRSAKHGRCSPRRPCRLVIQSPGRAGAVGDRSARLVVFADILAAGFVIMLDAAFVRANLDAVKRNCDNRNVTADVDRVVALDDERKRLLTEAQAVQQRANEVSKKTGQEKDAAV